jgi:hexosaminidase
LFRHEKITLPYLQITDYPQLSWRGLMLDLSRHFYSIEALKDIIDLLAYYKMNVFHWHMTDNEGWRLEMKKYPKLTSIGSWRKEIYGSKMYGQDSSLNWKDTYRYGGYYSQEEARELVAYAAERQITIVPEIEMPGHSGAVLAAYPQFSCSQLPQSVPNSALFNKYNPAPSPNQEYCAGNDSSFLFLQDVLREVMSIFPSPYIHIGGDEVDKTHWKQCARCQKRMQDERLADESELQSYFIKRIARFLETNDRKLIG